MRQIGTLVGSGAIAFGKRTFWVQLSEKIPKGIELSEMTLEEVKEMQAKDPEYKEHVL